MRCAWFLLAVAAVAWPQDEKRIAELIQQLDDDDPAVRDEAQQTLIEIGKPALPALESAMKSDSAEVRERATAACRQIQWRLGRPDFLKRITPAERELLRDRRAFYWDQPRCTLLEALEAGAGDEPKEEEELPWKDGERYSVWKFLNRECFAGAKVQSAMSEGWQRWRAATEKMTLHLAAPKDGRWPHIAIIEAPFRLTDDSVRRNPKGVIDALAPLAKADGWEGLHGDPQRIEGDGKLTGVLYEFRWEQTKPFPSLRYVFLKESFALVCIAYQ